MLICIGDGMRDSLMNGAVTGSSNLSDGLLPFLHASLPLKSIHITSRFGMRYHPILHRYCLHNGVDLKAHYENVFSMFPGRVVSIGHNKRSGKYVVIQTAGYSISYSHLSSILVRDSQYINAGEVIAVSGNTGMSTGPHLHLTTKKDGKVIDPAILLNFVKGMITPSCIFYNTIFLFYSCFYYRLSSRILLIHFILIRILSCGQV